MTKFKLVIYTILMAAFVSTNIYSAETSKKTTQKPAAKNAKRFEIILTNTKNITLRAQIKNLAPDEQLFLHNIIQHSELKIVDASGKPVAYIDDRANRKFDNSIYKEDYVKLPANGSLEFFKTSIDEIPEGYTLDWGPYTYEKLVPGNYKVYVEWNSQRDDWLDDSTQKKGKFDSVWKGKLTSNSVELKLK